ncbi:hypothetical protein JW998_13415 [candidate division KSB1 bacterium]|nr:hypothetical protein [candidate division KSB1 bacterium]
MRISALLIFTLCFAGSAAEIPGAKRSVSCAELQRQFARPDMLYAPSIFWFWDRPLDPAVQARIEEMTRKMIGQGFNPGYVHARFNMVGDPDLPIEQWLSGDWFRAFGRALAETERLNAYLGYVDEFWWPSGRAADRVLEKNPDMWAESLKWETMDVAGGSAIQIGESFFVVAAELRSAADSLTTRVLIDLERQRQQICKDAALNNLEIVPHTPAVISSATLQLIGSGSPFVWRAPAEGAWRIYVFNKYYHPGCDGGRLNYLDGRLSELFLREAHAPYAAHFPQALGRRVPGVFIDHEGDYGYKLAWSADLEERYQQVFGRDIRLWMPLLVDRDLEGRYVKARWSWFEVVSDIYVEFFKGTVQWCLDHGLYAISNLWEESLMWQASAVGDFFKAQRIFSMPGTDALGLRILELHDFMETKSVCEFEGRRMQSEIMGAAGLWGFDNITIKGAANAAIAWGVSHIVPHAIWLTRKLAGNPWLPDWYEQNPWWPQMHLWTDFVRRASYVNSHGHVAADVLLLNPMDSVWGLCGPGVFDPAFKGRVPVPAVLPLGTATDILRTPAQVKEQSAWWCPPKMDDWYSAEVHRINAIYSQVMDDLIKFRIEFLVADRGYMRQMRVEEGALVRDPFRFKTLILPAMHILPKDVARTILEFAKKGGHVYVLAAWPAGSTENGLYDAEIDSIVAKLQANPRVIFCDSSLVAELSKGEEHLASHLDFVSGEFDMLQAHRRINGRDFFWLANQGDSSRQCTFIRRGEHLAFVKWNCENGHIEPLTVRDNTNGSCIDVTFAPWEAFWLADAGSYTARTEQFTGADTIDLTGPWRVRAEAGIQPPLDKNAAMPEEFSTGLLVELTDWRAWGLANWSGVLTYEMEMTIDEVAAKTLLDVGQVYASAHLRVNGADAGERLWPPYQFEISDLIRPGRNSILLTVGNLVNNSWGDGRPAGLYGPVRLIRCTR